MSYIDKNLLPDEKILFRTKKHIILFFYPLLCTIIIIYFAHLSKTVFTIFSGLQSLPFTVNGILGGIALIYWLYAWLEYRFSDFAVTNKRIMMREGFFYRHTREMRLNTISQVDVDQSLLGQLLDYGILSINAFGAYDSFTLIAKPYAFQKCINEQIDRQK